MSAHIARGKVQISRACVLQYYSAAASFSSLDTRAPAEFPSQSARAAAARAHVHRILLSLPQFCLLFHKSFDCSFPVPTLSPVAHEPLPKYRFPGSPVSKKHITKNNKILPKISRSKF
jgi:hypothetical protein